MGAGAVGGQPSSSEWQNVKVTMKGQETTISVKGEEGLKNLESIIGKDHDVSMSELAALTNNTAQAMDGEQTSHRIEIKGGDKAKFDVAGLGRFMAFGTQQLAAPATQKTIFSHTIQGGSALRPKLDEDYASFQKRFDSDLATFVTDPAVSNDDKIRYLQAALQTEFTADAPQQQAVSARTNGISKDGLQENQKFLQHGRDILKTYIQLLGGDPNGSFRQLPAVERR